jgi:transcriptional regulator with XRE-family HTH domain
MNVVTAPIIAYPARMISARQIRAARAMVGWTQDRLAEAAGLSLAVVNNVERDVTDPRRSTLDAIQRALETEGVEFLSERQNSPDGGQGVRMRLSR